VRTTTPSGATPGMSPTPLQCLPKDYDPPTKDYLSYCGRPARFGTPLSGYYWRVTAVVNPATCRWSCTCAAPSKDGGATVPLPDGGATVPLPDGSVPDVGAREGGDSQDSGLGMRGCSVDSDCSNPCAESVCQGGSCVALQSAPDGQSCPGGVCRAGICSIP
jgi:hypothetical protein